MHSKVENPCPFCERTFPRFDNMMIHVGLHNNTGRKAPRVAFHPRAADFLEEMKRNSRLRKKSVVKTEAEPAFSVKQEGTPSQEDEKKPAVEPESA